MNANTLPDRAVLFQNGLPAVATTRMFYEKRPGENGAPEVNVLKFESKPVFRSGTFRDSWGDQYTWEPLHVHEMVSHFNYLKERQIFEDVPVRAGHPSILGGNPIHGLIGYVTSLRAEKHVNPVDGKEYEYLLADYEILDPVAQEKLASKLWRNRSAEVGRYVDNNDAEYFPAFMGVAYVDMPAVEALNAFSKADPNRSVHFMMEESMSGSSLPKTVGSQTEDTPKPIQFSLAGISESDPGKVQNYISGLEKTNADLVTKVTQLTEYQKNIEQNLRSDYVKGLAKENKIGAEQIDSLTAFAQSLDEKQYEAWKKAYEAAPPQQMFDNHGQQQSTPPPAGGNADAKPEQNAIDKSIVQRFARLNYSHEAIERTDSYRRLASKGLNFSQMLEETTADSK